MNAELKLVKIGNSVGVVLPREVLSSLRVGLGDKVFISEQPDGVKLTAHDPAFVDAMRAAEEIMREDRDILAVLAR